jgi:hypothetical protein
MSSKAAVAIVSGHFKFYVNEERMMPSVMASIAALQKETVVNDVSHITIDTALRIQEIISQMTGRHCPSLRDEIFHTRGLLTASTAKKLANLNAAFLHFRHALSLSCDELLECVRSELKGVAFVSDSAEVISDVGCDVALGEAITTEEVITADLFDIRSSVDVQEMVLRKLDLILSGLALALPGRRPMEVSGTTADAEVLAGPGFAGEWIALPPVVMCACPSQFAIQAHGVVALDAVDKNLPVGSQVGALAGNRCEASDTDCEQSYAVRSYELPLEEACTLSVQGSEVNLVDPLTVFEELHEDGFLACQEIRADSANAYAFADVMATLSASEARQAASIAAFRFLSGFQGA